MAKQFDLHASWNDYCNNLVMCIIENTLKYKKKNYFPYDENT